MISVFLVDDHELLRRGVAELIGSDDRLEVVGESERVRGTLARVAATRPNVVVLDVHLPDGSGIDLCRSIRSAYPDSRCIMLTAYDEDSASVASVLAGAAGYVMKTIRGGNLLDAIRRAAHGEVLFSKDVAQRVRESVTGQVTDAVSPRVELTLRERQALQLITEGLTNRQIGARLGIAEKTVKNYVSGLLAKLGMERRTQVAAYGASEHPGESGSFTTRRA